MTLPREPFQLIVAGLIFVTLSRIHQHYSFIQVFRPGKLLFLAAVGYAVLRPQVLNLRAAWTAWPTRAVAALGVLACLSIPFSISVGSSGRFVLETYSKVLLVFFITVSAIRDPRDLYLFVWTYVLACGFVVYTALFGFSLVQERGVFRLGGLHMYDANDIGVILNVGLPIALVLFFNSNGWGRLVSGSVLVGIGAALARSGSRGGFLGLIVVGAALLVRLKRVSVAKRSAAVLVVLIGLVLMAPQGYWDRMKSLTEPTEDYNWDTPYGRKAIAKRGMGYMLSHPLTGVGAGNFGRAEWQLSEIGRKRERLGLGFKLTAAHNSFVLVGAELGIPGLVVFCLIVFGGLVGMLRLRRRLPEGFRARGPPWRLVDDMTLLLPVAWLGFAVTAFFVTWTYLDLVYFLTALTAGVYVSAWRLWSAEPPFARASRTDRTPAPGRYRRRAVSR